MEADIVANDADGDQDMGIDEFLQESARTNCSPSPPRPYKLPKRHYEATTNDDHDHDKMEDKLQDDSLEISSNPASERSVFEKNESTDDKSATEDHEPQPK